MKIDTSEGSFTVSMYFEACWESSPEGQARPLHTTSCRVLRRHTPLLRHYLGFTHKFAQPTASIRSLSVIATGQSSASVHSLICFLLCWMDYSMTQLIPFNPFHPLPPASDPTPRSNLSLLCLVALENCVVRCAPLRCSQLHCSAAPPLLCMLCAGSLSRRRCSPAAAHHCVARFLPHSSERGYA
jgi:hypothetical protein